MKKCVEFSYLQFIASMSFEGVIIVLWLFTIYQTICIPFTLITYFQNPQTKRALKFNIHLKTILNIFLSPTLNQNSNSNHNRNPTYKPNGASGVFWNMSLKIVIYKIFTAQRDHVKFPWKESIIQICQFVIFVVRII